MHTPRVQSAYLPVQPSSKASARPVSLALLGMPTLGLSLSITTVAALVPLLLRPLTSSTTVIGAVIASEGLLALILPLWLGRLSDRTRSRLGRRLPFILLGAPLCAFSLIVLPFARSLPEIAAAVVGFYIGYFVIYPPYRALYPDLVPRNELGRSQGIQTLFRELGLLLGLGASPLLLTFSRPLPFFVGATVSLTLCLVFVLRIRRSVQLEERPSQPRSTRELGLTIAALLRRHPDVLRVLLANSLWEFALAGLKTFVLLYIVVAIGRTPAVAAGLVAIVGLVAVVAAPIAGYLADRFGIIRVMRVALLVFALGLLTPTLTGSLSVLLPALPLIGFGGAVAMTLPYALLAERLPRQSHGLGAGLYEFSRGLGALFGPLVTGMAIDVARRWMTSSSGYGAMWLVVAAALLVSVPLLPTSKR